MSKSGADLIIRYIDELARGRSRVESVIRGRAGEEVQGLANTILSSVVRASVPPTVPQIGRSLGYPRQTVQRHVDTLVEQGLIELVDNPDHKTARRLVGTARGQALYAAKNASIEGWAEEFAARFDRAELEAMVLMMRKVRQELEGIARRREG